MFGLLDTCIVEIVEYKRAQPLGADRGSGLPQHFSLSPNWMVGLSDAFMVGLLNAFMVGLLDVLMVWIVECIHGWIVVHARLVVGYING